MTPAKPNCLKRGCKHFKGWNTDSETYCTPICRAFPKGIPEDIAFGDNPHTKPYAGDHGIQFEPGGSMR